MRNSEETIFLNEYDLNEADGLLAERVTNPYLRMEKAVPLTERLETKYGILETGLRRLRKSMREDAFDQLIETLERVTVNDGRAMLITPTERQRSLLEREYIPQLLKAFEVNYVRIVAHK